MPTGPWDRLPLPSLLTYTSLSLGLFVYLIFNIIEVVNNPKYGASVTSLKDDFDNIEKNILEKINFSYLERNIFEKINFSHFPDALKNVMIYIIKDHVAQWIIINSTACSIILFGKLVQLMSFGELRGVEIINLREKIGNYFLYKCIFMFGIIKVQSPREFAGYVAWFGALGFLQIFVQLSKDRLEYIVTSNSRGIVWKRFKIVSLLLCIFTIANYMLYICCNLKELNYNDFAFMIAECLSIILRVPHIILKYVIDPFEAKFIRDRSQRYNMARNSLANYIMSRMEVSFTYYLSVGLELADLCLELLHYLHMILWGNMIFSFATFAICMHIRFLVTDIQKKLKKHRNYMWILNHMEKQYPLASKDELNKNSDNCAICWEKMEVARKLPCKHLFHSICLQLWLEQDTSCPICRFVLNINGSNVSRTRRPRGLFQFRTDRGHIRFNGSRYWTWLPTFSIHVLSGITIGPELSESQLETLVSQVLLVFPHYPRDLILENLRITQSVNVTMNNILEGNLPIPENNIIEESSSNVDSEHSISSDTSITNQRTEENSDGVEEATDVNSDGSGNSSSSSISIDSTNEIHSPNLPASQSGISLNDNFMELNTTTPFHSTATEREFVLKMRKQQLLHKAKKRFVDKHQSGEG